MRHPRAGVVSLFCVLAIGLGACSTVEDLPIPRVEAQTPLAVETDQSRSSMAFSKLAVRMEPGSIVGVRRGGAICAGRRLKIGDEMTDRVRRQATEVFREESARHGYAAAKTEDSLFQDAEDLSVDYLVGAGIVDIVVNYCVEDYGESYLKLDWQIFDREANKIVYQTQTEGAYRTESLHREASAVELLLEAFRAAARNLMADGTYHSLMSESKGSGA